MFLIPCGVSAVGFNPSECPERKDLLEVLWQPGLQVGMSGNRCKIY